MSIIAANLIAALKKANIKFAVGPEDAFVIPVKKDWMWLAQPRGKRIYVIEVVKQNKSDEPCRRGEVGMLKPAEVVKQIKRLTNPKAIGIGVPYRRAII